MEVHPGVRRLLLVLLGLWLVGGIALGGLLLVQHLIALPAPDASNAQLRGQMNRVFDGGWRGDGKWRVMHVMYRDCPCSRRTISHLTAGGRPGDLDELVLLVDDEGRAGEEDAKLVAHGYRVLIITPDELHRDYDLEAAPVLVIARPDGALVYVGGYTRHKRTNAYEDLRILADLRQQGERDALPVFGCPTSERLSHLLDPLGLRRK